MEHLKFRINISYWLFLAVAVVFKRGYFATVYSLSMVLHECAHYLVAKKLFYRCTEIQIGVFGAVLYGEFVDVRGSDRIKIALAGPLCNLSICLVCLAFWWILPDSYYFTETVVTSNLSMACVNLLPCYPLDGGRVLTGVLEDRYSGDALKLTKILTCIFSAATFGLFVLSLVTEHNLFNVGLLSLGLFIGVFAQSGGEGYAQSVLAPNRGRFLKKGMEKKTLVFNCDCVLRDVAKRMQGNFLYCLEVVDNNMVLQNSYSIEQLEKFVLCCSLDIKLKDLPNYRE